MYCQSKHIFGGIEFFKNNFFLKQLLIIFFIHNNMISENFHTIERLILLAVPGLRQSVS